MGDLTVHLLIFGLSNLLFGAVLAAFLLRRVGVGMLGAPATVVLGLGLAPFTLTWLLNMLLLLAPGTAPGLAVAVVCLVMGAFALGGGTGWRTLKHTLVQIAYGMGNTSMWPYLFFSGAMVFGTGIMLIYKPLVDHDILEYGVQGRHFLDTMAIRYEAHHYDPSNGFYYVGLHGFSFPLLFTWEGIVQSLTGTTGDAWVRVQTPWFAWLLVSFVWAMIRRIGAWLAVWAAGAFTLTIGFLYLNTIYHVDPVRIFLFTASVAAFMAQLRAPTRPGLLLWGVLLGAHALTHSLGMILAPFMLGAYFLAAAGSVMDRSSRVLVATLAFVVAGGFHYLLDITIGTGWLFKDITWF